MGSATSSRGTLRSNTIDIIRVGRQHTFSRAPVLLTSCYAYAQTSEARNLRPFSAPHLCRHKPLDIAMPGYIEHLTPCTRRDTSSLLQAFSPPSSQGYSSGGHFLFLLLPVLSRSYSLYSGEHFLLYVFVI